MRSHCMSADAAEGSAGRRRDPGHGRSFGSVGLLLTVAGVVVAAACVGGYVTYGVTLTRRTKADMAYRLGPLVGERVALGVPMGKGFVFGIEGTLESVGPGAVRLRDLEGRVLDVSLVTILKVKVLPSERPPKPVVVPEHRRPWWQRLDGVPPSIEWSPPSQPWQHPDEADLV